MWKITGNTHGDADSGFPSWHRIARSAGAGSSRTSPGAERNANQPRRGAECESEVWASSPRLVMRGAGKPTPGLGRLCPFAAGLGPCGVAARR